MQEIGEFVLTTACRQLRRWIDSGMKPIRMAVNLSLCQFLRGDIVSTVERVLCENDLSPGLLELELSERGVLNQRTEIIDTVRKLKSLGVRISVDDFGTGQSAISYLKDLPIDVVKIDRSYISGESGDGRGEAIASCMVLLAQGLDATVIAEGVETREQLQMVRDWGSEECQGFYHCAAISGDEFQTRFAKSPTF
jgi:EAL domain-containing protein (putative c-di-GMP-specific phosphodiesterase class I)